MRIGRTLPPGAAPIHFTDVVSGLRGLVRGKGEIQRFEAGLATYFNVKHCFLLSSGKAALTVVLTALHRLYPHRDEVIIPAYTCYSVPSAICRAGLNIRLCDIDPDTLDFNFTQLQEMLSTKNNPDAGTRVLAVIPTHLFGMAADVKKTRKITAAHGVFMVEDAAQAMGGQLQGQKLGTLGDAGVFSLGRGKAFSTVEGGIVLTDNTLLAEQIMEEMEKIPDYGPGDILKLIGYAVVLNVFMRPAFFWLPKSLPFLKLGETLFQTSFPMKKMTAFQAGLACKWQRRLEILSQGRRCKSDLFRAAFQSGSNQVCNLFPQGREGQILLRFPLKLRGFDCLQQIFSKGDRKGLGVMRGYPDAIHGIVALKDRFRNHQYPGAVEIARCLITLPVHAFVSEKDCKKIIALMDSGEFK